MCVCVSVCVCVCMHLEEDLELIQSITAMQWALLERIGRSRYQGEVTQGKNSLQFTRENPKTLFYHRKHLLKKVDQFQC